MRAAVPAVAVRAAMDERAELAERAVSAASPSAVRQPVRPGAVWQWAATAAALTSAALAAGSLEQKPVARSAEPLLVEAVPQPASEVAPMPERGSAPSQVLAQPAHFPSFLL